MKYSDDEYCQKKRPSKLEIVKGFGFAKILLIIIVILVVMMGWDRLRFENGKNPTFARDMGGKSFTLYSGIGYSVYIYEGGKENEWVWFFE